MRQQLTLWGALWAGFGILAFMPLVWHIVHQEPLKQQFQAAARMQLAASHLQRLAQSAVSGNAGAFPQLREAEQTISGGLEGLLQGSGVVEQASARIQPLVSEVNQQWEPVKTSVSTLLGFEKALTDLEKRVRAINAREAEMLDLADQIQSTLAQGGGSARDLYHAGQLVSFATRIPQGARHMLSRPDPDKWARELEAGARAYPEARFVIEIGAQASRWVLFDRAGDVSAEPGILDFALNDVCAAGSGSFLEQQAARLKMSIEEFARLAASAKRGAAIAGRCSVFAKTDMIHLQQKGTPPGEIAYGHCQALARNFTATVLKGRESLPPVLLAGGGFRNRGLVNAFREVLRLGEGECRVAEPPQLLGALGAARASRGA